MQRGGQHRSTDHPDRIRTDLGAGRAPRKSRKHEIEGQETSRRPRTLLIASGGPAYPRRLRQAPWAAPQWGRLKAGSPSRLRLTAFPTDQSIKRPWASAGLPSAVCHLELEPPSTGRRRGSGWPPTDRSGSADTEAARTERPLSRGQRTGERREGAKPRRPDVALPRRGVEA